VSSSPEQRSPWSPTPPAEHEADQRVIMYGITWAGYEAQLALRGEVAVPRVAYLDGAMELMSPSRDHERLKSYIGQLIVAYALERDIELSSYGAWTLRHAPKEAGLEPDDCFIIGADQNVDRPNLAIEVIWTSGGLNKLEIYKRLGVAEVWTWRANRIEIRALRDTDYLLISQSEQLPGIDTSTVLASLDYPTVTQAIRAFRKLLKR